MQEQLRDWLARSGFGPATDLAPMQAGLGSTSLWAFTSAPDGERLVVRVFPTGALHTAARETAAMQAAHRGGVPVPIVRAQAEIAGRPLLVTSFMPGTIANQVILSEPARVATLGRAMGVTLGTIHRVRAPEAVATPDREWIAAGGPALAPISEQLARVPNQDRLIHLDYHPYNVLVSNGEISGVIDWENARAGSPHADLARSRAILRAAMIGGAIPPEAVPVLAAFEQALVEGHASVVGEDPHPHLSRAWGLAMTTADLEQQSAKEGNPFAPSTIAHLAQERDAAIATAQSS